MVNIHGLKFEFLGNIKYVNKFLKCIKSTEVLAVQKGIARPKPDEKGIQTGKQEEKPLFSLEALSDPTNLNFILTAS